MDSLKCDAMKRRCTHVNNDDDQIYNMHFMLPSSSLEATGVKHLQALLHPHSRLSTRESRIKEFQRHSCSPVFSPSSSAKVSNDILLLCLVMTHTSQLTETSQMGVALLFEYQIAPQLGT
jgi:hypothetical protein